MGKHQHTNTHPAEQASTQQGTAGTTEAQGFLASVLKYSVATYVGFGISALALILRGWLGPEKTADPYLFMVSTSTLMNIGILGLDQSLLRFFSEPPQGHTGRSLFSLCLRISAFVMLCAGVVCSLLFPQQLAQLLSFDALGPQIVPLLFLNAFFYMLMRYLNVLLRLEGRLGLYTAQTVVMQACFNLVYLFAGFFTDKTIYFALLAIASFALSVGVFALRAGVRLRLPAGTASAGTAYKRLVPYGLALAPTGIMLMLNTTFSSAYVGNTLGLVAKGVFGYGVSLSQMVSAIQAGFSTFWGPYVFANYKTQQTRIMKVQDVLCFLIFSFFCCLVAFEDVLFWLFPAYRECLTFFPLLMLNVVFFILCEGTVYGISIAKKPLYDTVGIALYAVLNIALCLYLTPLYGLAGAAFALAASAGAMFLFRTVVAQRFYRTIARPAKTAAGFALCFLVTFAGLALHANFLLKGLCCLAALVLYCLLYRAELVRCVQLALSILKGIFRKKTHAKTTTEHS
ncbi:hypothetical protein LJB77_00415 [Ruminococcaceae bacterium OttesenSCG-928-N02]|nr:hypothetical protein [Ruminococcaceae bacterium OttesenSCG-928-N02]